MHSHPWRQHMEQHRPDLVQEVRLWWPDTYRLVPRGTELLWIAAYTGGLPGEDPASFFARFGEYVAAVGRDRALLVQAGDPSPAEVAARVDRIDSLGQADVQDRYVQLLRGVWRELMPIWERDGLPLVRLECTRLRQRLDDGANLLELLPSQHFVQFDEYAAIVHRAEDGQRPIIVTPLHFAGGGYLLNMEVEGTAVLLGYGSRLEGVHHALAQKAANVALRLKAFSDPTRLTLLSTIGELDVAVGDLARLLDITQPSVSGHLKMLQEAGLVTVRKKGVKSFYRADADAIEALINETRDLLP